ncbi:FAD-binding protein [Salinactinospora qingdaonensis]|uniref:FAD-binding PCMH-type domain-containing protein n=1 Tax=Salinactinospora qingdaonensis TaxID=702744 RepID=A0ABP7FNG8_9ACTN
MALESQDTATTSPDPAALAALVEGEVSTDDATLAWAARDWGSIVQQRPRVVVRPASVADVVAVVGFAAEHGVSLAARGAGHSPFGQGQSDGLVLDMTSMAAVHRVDRDGVVVEAGARWSDVLAATVQAGLTPPTLTDYMHVTVGGTLAVGGIGGATHHYGTQVDTVRELDVVTGTGELHTCSPTHNRDLFDAVRGGLGQCGIVVRATITLVEAPPRTRRWQLYYDDFDRYLREQRAVVAEGRFDYVEGQIVPAAPETQARWRYMLEVAAYYGAAPHPGEPDEAALLGDLGDDRPSAEVVDSTYPEFAHRMAPAEEFLRTEGSWFHPHPWLNVFLPEQATGPLVSHVLEHTDLARDIGATGLLMLYPVRADRLRAPLVRVPEGELVFLFALLRTGDPYAVTDTARMIEANRDLYERAVAAGGCVYPANALAMTPQDWQRHFAGQWDRLAGARHRFDPAGVLCPGQRVFPGPAAPPTPDPQ